MKIGKKDEWGKKTGWINWTNFSMKTTPRTQTNKLSCFFDRLDGIFSCKRYIYVFYAVRKSKFRIRKGHPVCELWNLFWSNELLFFRWRGRDVSSEGHFFHVLGQESVLEVFFVLLGFQKKIFWWPLVLFLDEQSESDFLNSLCEFETQISNSEYSKTVSEYCA